MNDRRPDPVMVIGATGTHGGAVARELLAAGYAVRALVRNPGSGRALSLRETGAVLVTGDLDDRGSLVRAFHDVAVVYAVTTPFAGGAGEEERQGDNIIAAAGRADLPWLLLASVAAGPGAGAPLRQQGAHRARLAGQRRPVDGDRAQLLLRERRRRRRRR
jgi:uncharacterized protein YbjT (DUF2867 family)